AIALLSSLQTLRGVPSLTAQRGHAEDRCAVRNATVGRPFRAVRELVRVPRTTQRHSESAAMRLATLVSHRYDFGLTWIQAERDRRSCLVLFLGRVWIGSGRRIWVRPFLVDGENLDVLQNGSSHYVTERFAVGAMKADL